MTAAELLPAKQTRYDNDPALLTQVLKPYRPHCRYLTSATVTADGEPRDGGRVGAECEFEIPESCYIDDTGHFNSVEFNICYNQMLYYVVAKSVKDGLMQPFTEWTMDDYWQRQLADFLITDFHSTFKRPMRGGRFFGEIGVVNVLEWEGSDIRQPLVVVHTVCRYWDVQGQCHVEERDRAVGHRCWRDRVAC
jgi:hypothetical protein